MRCPTDKGLQLPPDVRWFVGQPHTIIAADGGALGSPSGEVLRSAKVSHEQDNDEHIGRDAQLRIAAETHRSEPRHNKAYAERVEGHPVVRPADGAEPLIGVFSTWGIHADFYDHGFGGCRDSERCP